MMETEVADGEEREVFHGDLSIGGGEVSTLSNLIIVWRLVVRGCEKTKLVDVHI